jgi:hypothetical protein
MTEFETPSAHALVDVEGPSADEVASITRALRRWYDRAGVRVDPRRILRDEHREGLHHWPPELTPFIDHPLVVERGAAARDELLVRQLYQYLQFTASYELRVINRATEIIANGRSGLQLPSAVRLDAYKIYVDEGYHALYSADVIHQVEAASGIEFRPFDFEAFLGYLRDAQDAAPVTLRRVVAMLVVVVFETLITATLTQIPRQGNVISLVREIVTDHAEDEGRHHVFFSEFFSYLWGQLDARQRSAVGVLIPEFVARPLEPPRPALRDALAGVGLDRDQVEQVLEESYPRERTADAIRHTAKATLKLFGRHGLYDDPRTREAFVARGLLTEAAA